MAMKPIPASLSRMAAAAGLGLAALAAGMAPAADFGAFRFSGDIAGGARAAGDDTGLFVAGDVTVALPLALGFGLEAGIYGLGWDLADDPGTPHETYGALTWEGGGVTIAAGVPRPAYDRTILSPLDRWDPVRGRAGDRMAMTRSRVTWGAAYDGGLPLGVTVSGGGPIEWAVSAHDMDDVRVAGLALGRDSGATVMGIALEWASDGEFGAKLGFEREFGAFTAGFAGYRAAAPDDGTMAEGWLTWHAMDALDLSALVQVPGSGSSLGGVAGEWRMGGNASLTGALTRESGETAAALGLDWKF